MIRVRIVATSPVVRAGLASILADAPDITVVSEIAPDDDGGDADVVLLDTGDLDDAGDANLDDEAGRNAVVVLGDHFDPAEAGRLLRAGARGIIDGDATPDAIVAAVHAAAAGLTVVSGAGLESLAGQPVGRGPSHASSSTDQGVTPRETEILRLLAEGLGNKAIARRLGISEHTVKAHVSSILVKLGAGSRAEAVAIGARQGLILL
ncbi:MAG: LuxR C-terminal-related transcriptional regulator [Longimicrobiales bacterium]